MFAIAIPLILAINIVLLPLALHASGYLVSDPTGLRIYGHTTKRLVQSTIPVCIAPNPVSLIHVFCGSYKQVDFSLYDQTSSSKLLNISPLTHFPRCITKHSSFSSNYFTQAWIDRLNNLQILFTYSPLYPFAGDITKLNFKITSLSDSKPLDPTQIHIALITNPSVTLSTNHTNITANDFVSYNNISSTCGIFYLNYHFSQQGDHQTIVKIVTKDEQSALASFIVPVLSPSQTNRAMYGIYDH